MKEPPPPSMDSRRYYEPHALLLLERPLVLAGWLPDFTREVGRRLSAPLGLPFADVNRLIEHHAGRSIDEILAEAGEAALRQLEKRCLLEALQMLPAGILVLGDGALIDQEIARTVSSAAILVALDLDLPNLFWKLKALGGEGKISGWPFPGDGLPLSLETLRESYAERRPGLDLAHHSLDIRAFTPAAAAARLLREIPALNS